MKKLNLLFWLTGIFICLSLIINNFNTATAAPQKKIAVGRFISATNSRFGALVRSQVETGVLNALVQNKKYTVVERSSLDQIFKELGLQNSGVIDGNTAIEIGKLSGADYTMLGTIVAAEVSENFMGNKAKVTFEIRIVDNKTGIVLSSDMVTATKTGPMFSSSYSGQRALLSDATAEASSKIAAKMNAVDPLIGTVCEINHRQNLIYFDLGTDDGVNVGDKYDIYTEGKLITHPKTGEILGTSEKQLASIEVIDVKPGLSIGKIKKSNERIQIGDKVKQDVK